MAPTDEAIQDKAGESDQKGSTGANDQTVALPGEEENEKPEGGADNDWHDFESQYSMALAQSAMVEREKWSSNVEFLLSCISSAVGLGNIWRFPFTCGQNGGGAFLIPYLIVVFVIGRPLYYLELSLGQFSSRGSVKVWEMVPLLRGIGYGTGFASFMVSTFYVVIMAWTILYGAYSLYWPFPWTYPIYGNSTKLFFLQGLFKDEPVTVGYNGSDFKYNLLFSAGKGLGPPSWEQMLALLAAWILIWLALVKGVSGSGKVAYFTAIFPYVVLITLLGVGCSLPGAKNGILYFLKPEWNSILQPKTWFEAVGQCFFSLGVGFGGCVMFSSFNHFNHNLGRDVLIISLVDTFTSFLAGITIFSIIGNIAHTSGEKIADIAKADGAALAFISYPQAMRPEWGAGAQVLSFIFFFMLLTLGVGSATALVGTTTTIFEDAFPNVKKWIIVTINCSLGLIGGIIYTCPAGSNVIDIVNDFGATFVIYVFAFMEICGLVFIYGLKNFCNDIEFMIGRKVSIYWIVCWLMLPPLLLIILVFHLATVKKRPNFPDSAQIAGWIMSAVILVIPIFFAVRVVQTKRSSSCKKRFLASLYPTRRWGPKDPVIKEAWRRFRLTRNTEFALTVRMKALFKVPTNAGQPPLSVLQSQAPSSSVLESQDPVGPSNVHRTSSGPNVVDSEYPTEVNVVASRTSVEAKPPNAKPKSFGGWFS